ncbi:MAG TPA: T9SS type B sorting domain-containing protein [Flavobacterium sp.]|nr:T9SS type B sorting domain-containing protein [Flavobacterium sp.]
MNLKKSVAVVFFLLISTYTYSQLAFCNGSKGDPIFTENFGSGTTYGPALQPGITNYIYVSSGFPQDGQYTLYYRTNIIPNSQNWHLSLDRTPESAGVLGKCLIVNAANAPGQFYKRTVPGLCVNTTFEFSAWLMNIYNPTTNSCGATEKPINVSFEIWNETQTVLLSSGNTGDIMGTNSPIWTQYGLTFTTTNQTSVVLIMKNNGVGGCGNDLAIDDIEFRSCGDLTTITNTLTTADSYKVCQNQGPISTTLQATTNGVKTYFYQWQSSSDGIIWSDIVGETAQKYTTPAINTSIYYRVKVAQDVANLSNNFCSTSSNVFNISFLKSPNNSVSNGDKIICSNQVIPELSVSTASGTGVNWYDATTGGNLLKSNSTTYTPLNQGVFYAEAYDLSTNCTSALRTAVSLTIVQLPTASISANPLSVCSGQNSTISFVGTPNSIVTYKVDNGVNQTITLDNNGNESFSTPNLTSDSTYSLISVSLNGLNGCSQQLSKSITITVSPKPTASISANPISVCSGQNTTISFVGTPNSIVTYKVDNGVNQTITLDNNGNESLFTPNLTSDSTYSLVSVSSNGTNGCTQPLSESITIIVGFLPTATFSANPASVCSGQSSTLSFIGTPNANVNYNVDGGVNQLITLDNIGKASVTTPNLTSDSTYNLVSVSLNGSSGCTQSLSQSITITVSAMPTAMISANPMSVCSGQNSTISFIGTPNSIVTYKVDNQANQTILLDTNGNASITTPIITSNITYSLISISSNGCTQPLSDSITIITGTLPTATFSGSPLAVCSGQSTTLNFIGTPNAIVNYSENGISVKSVTLNSEGLATVISQELFQNTTYQLINVVNANSSNCSQSLSDSVLITLNSTPIANFIGDTNYCSNEPIAITLTSDIIGTTFDWTVTQNGTTGATSGSGNQINQVLMVNEIQGTAIYYVTPFYNGCKGNTIEVKVTIYPLPNPTLEDGAICLNSEGTADKPYNLNTNLNETEYSFVWYYEGNLIANAYSNKYDAYQVGLYSVISTNKITGCVSETVTATVTEAINGERLQIIQSENFAQNPYISVTVIGGEGPFLYQLDDFGFQTSNVFYNVSSGTHYITVIDQSFCTNLSATVTIINYPRFFTPNNDGYNDTWNIKDVDSNSKIQIFDRYGKLLKEIKTNSEGWDGSFNGKPLFSNDYWFVLYYIENGVEKTFKSHFTLKK